MLQCLKDYHDALDLFLTAFIFALGLIIERKTKKIQTALTWKEFRDPALAFSHEVVDTLSAATGLCEADPVKLPAGEFWNRYNANLSKLSAHIDYGRLVIPNLYLEDNSAFGGIRENALDCIYVAYRISKAIDYSATAHNSIPTKNSNHPQYSVILEMLKKLPNQASVRVVENKPTFKGWSCRLVLVEAKRQFVEEISKLIQARQWANDIKSLSGRG